MIPSNFQLLAAVSLFIAGCSYGSQESSDGSEHSSHSSHSSPHGLTLDNGEKWKVNPEMMPHFVNSEKAIKNFPDQQATNYPPLAANLDKIATDLVNSCSMDGRAHDELHKWLVPYLDLVDELSTTTDVESANRVVKEMVEWFVVFHEYFE